MREKQDANRYNKAGGQVGAQAKMNPRLSGGTFAWQKMKMSLLSPQTFLCRAPSSALTELGIDLCLATSTPMLLSLH